MPGTHYVTLDNQMPQGIVPINQYIFGLVAFTDVGL
jgi:hypothetical protein